MSLSIPIEIRPQPNETTCGPSCLDAVYRYWDVSVEGSHPLDTIEQLPGGGTLAVQLAIDALRRGMEATITTFNLHLFDPTWFRHQSEASFGEHLADKLRRQLVIKRDDPTVDAVRLGRSTKAYIEFLQLGGQVRMQPFEETVISRPLAHGLPILCGLSSTYLYQEARERESESEPGKFKPDDTGGFPSGHFVVLHGYDASSGEVEIADPLHDNPFSSSHQYRASFHKLATAILLGIVTYDANLLVIAPAGSPL
ncbi:hypothetical protein [Rhodopirellula sp. MGV]|uniref:hypothetical protein n=1 Tax=Rhodopirellula sp. MGV TaxID=2023130 RepID=UPI000B96AAA3|nr:hypothetical protein [Rhodopirellula sp. MGV]OYP31141.1 hypothetical protein CGZ80_21360 [Rhodopirellula sp. MGV]PNY36035.1 hypothetical protein C2E31_15060 [Rhodopirellula baltica]